MTTKTPIREAAEELNHLGIINGDDIALAAKTIQRVLSGRCWLRLFRYVGKCRQIPTFRNATATTNAARRSGCE